ncbi:DUF4097 family beta strand repeat-containing protein [Galactobacter valiniphilus]|uniref:DUF4097 family beta strand repeat-containing protein n=1 Tax=Galactobacter valiniphilus TaxID=2676122 RepID=UPI003735FDD5
MQNFPVAGIPRVIIDLPSAILDLDTHEEATVLVRITAARPGRAADERAAERIEVSADADTVSLFHAGPKMFALGTAHVRITAPAGTLVEAKTGNGAITARGSWGQASLKTSNGSIRVDSAAGLRANTSNGPVTVGAVGGRAELTSSNGSLEVGEVFGDAELKTSNGDIRVAGAAGRLGAKTSAGTIRVGRSTGETTLKTSAGAISVASLEGGSLTAATSVGEIDIDVAQGVAVWVDASTKAGSVINELRATDGPASQATAELRASTSLGTVRLRRLAA